MPHWSPGIPGDLHTLGDTPFAHGAARTSRLGNLFRISLLLGLRPGEATALRWPALHLDDDVPTVDIIASLQRLYKTMRLTKPKTPTSVRTLGLPHAAVSAFREQKELQELERGASSNPHFNPLQLVFANEQGEPLDPSNVRRALASVAKRAGIGHVHPHLLRHAAASLMSAAGMRLEDISDTLGHRSVMVTAEIGAAGVDIGGPVPGDGFVGSDVVVVGAAGVDLVAEGEAVVDLLAEEPFIFHGPESAFA